jgi:hypothetical protein
MEGREGFRDEEPHLLHPSFSPFSSLSHLHDLPVLSSSLLPDLADLAEDII